MAEQNLKSRNFSVLWRLVALVRPHRTRFYLASISLLLGSVVSLGYPQLARFAIDWGMSEGNAGKLDDILYILVGVFVAHALFVWIRHYLMSWLGVRAVSDLRIKVFDRILGLPMSWFHERRSGELVGRLAADVAIVEEVIGSQMSMAVRNAVQLIGGIVLLVVVDWQLTLVMLAIVPPFILGAVYFGARLRRRSKKVQDELATASAQVQEAIGAIETVQAFVREKREAEDYERGIENAFGASVSLIRWRASFMSSVSVLSYGAIAVILWLGGRAVVDGRMSAGELTAFVMYTGIVATSLGTVASLYGALQRAAGATERLYDIIDLTPEIRDPESPVDLPDGPGAIEFRGVSFCYASRPDDQVLHDLNIELRAGEVVALVGPSGAGKTTVASLVPRFYDVSEGEVLVEGIDVRKLRVESLRRAIAIVSQEPVLFSGTIRDNIGYSEGKHSVEEIEQAAKDANAHDFILDFPEGYDTLVGERGVKLSGGQKQRIAIARALLANPRILILDEATSNLDSESEAAVQSALGSLMENRSTLVIAHRLSTVRDADRIVVLDKGRVAEQGSHEELMAKSGIYRRLVEHQLLGDETISAA